MEAEPGVFEGCGFVLFEEEVSDPGESIPDDEGGDEVEESEGEQYGSEELKDGQDRTDEVQSSVGPVAVLRHVERVKLVESLVLLIH